MSVEEENIDEIEEDILTTRYEVSANRRKRGRLAPWLASALRGVGQADPYTPPL